LNAQALENDFAETLENEMSKVVNFRPKQEDELERLAGYHRQGELKYRQRAADTRRSMKLKETMFKVDEKAEIARHKAAMDLIAEQRANNKELSERAIAADEKLAAYNRAAVDMLAAE
jgi:SPX domain protein involved in polyphosphate accumulation